MTKRLASLRRLHRLQAQMTALADNRLAAIERERHALGVERDLLHQFVAGVDSGGQRMLTAAVKRQHGLALRLDAVDAAAQAQHTKRQDSRRREKALEAASRDEAIVARREGEARDLAAVLESWFATRR